MNKKPVISMERRYVMAKVIEEWYSGLTDRKRDTAKVLGIEEGKVEEGARYVNKWLTGLRPIPPYFLIGLFRAIGNDAFRLTQSEADNYLARNTEIPDFSAEWPALSEHKAAEMVSGVVVPDKFRFKGAVASKGVGGIPKRKEPVASTTKRASRRKTSVAPKFEPVDSKVSEPAEGRPDLDMAFQILLGQLFLIVSALNGNETMREMFAKSPQAQRLVGQMVPQKATAEPAPTPVKQLAFGMKRLASQLVELSRRPSDDPERVWARKNLVGSTMSLYEAATILNLEFPAAFVDLISQFETITSALTRTGGKEK